MTQNTGQTIALVALTADAEASKTLAAETLASLETATAELETEKAKTTPEAIQALALAALSEAGQPAPLGGTEDEAPKGHLETFQSLKGSDATEYFRENEAAIKAEMRKQSK